MKICSLTLGTRLHLEAHWTYDEQCQPITVATLTCAVTGADAGQSTYRGHLNSEVVVTLGAQVNRTEALDAAAPAPEPLTFDLFLAPSA